MNKTAIKNFAVWVRRKLISEITYKAGLLGVTETGAAEPLPQSTKDLQFFDIGTKNYAEVQGAEIAQRDALVTAIRSKAREVDYKTAFQNVVEEVAYTWFNRMIAIRFMEINDYLPSRIRVLSSENSGKLEPDFVTTPFDTDLDFTPYERDRVLQLKDENRLDELFRALFIKQCNKLHEILPELFEATSDYTELLLTISFTDKDGVVYHLTHDIPESDFDISHTDEDGKTPGQVEIIGWMYQYYNTEPKDEVFALLKKNVKITKERIPAATQLFTPDWIVRYMVENSLGRLWVEHNIANTRGDDDEVPGDLNEALISNWKYYLGEAQQEPEVKAQLTELRRAYKDLNPEDIKVIDPCMGSGHILVYAFDVLMQIYEAQGYTQRDAARLIVEKNLYGLDIDKRAYQLAYFAVMMKARQYNRRILNGEVKPNLYAVQESNSINRNHLRYLGGGMSEIERNSAHNQLVGVLDQLTDAKEYGSILNVEPADWSLLERFIDTAETDAQLSLDSFGLEKTQGRLHQLMKQARAMAQKYDVVVTNPPYMGASGMNARLSQYVKDHFPDTKSDLFACFIERGNQMTVKHGYNCMVTMQSWMFLSSFEKMREKILRTKSITNLMHMENMVMGIAFGTAVTVFRNDYVTGYKGTYSQIKLQDIENDEPRVFPVLENRFAQTSTDNFSKIPGFPVAYWVSEQFLKVFGSPYTIGTQAAAKKGLTTSDDATFLRLWYEVPVAAVKFNAQNTDDANLSEAIWFPLNKGGEFRRWYGNNEYVVNWLNNGQKLRAFSKSVIRNEDYYFREAVSWNDITSGLVSFRYKAQGQIFNDAGPSIFGDNDTLKYLIAMGNSKVMQEICFFITPTIHYTVGQISNAPMIYPNCNEKRENVLDLSDNNILLSKNDWDSYETSWDFKRNPLVLGNSLSAAYAAWKQECEDRFQQLKKNEEELNRIFIDIYGLQDELTPEVADKDITVHRVFDNKDDVPESMKGSNYVRTMHDEIVSLISYAVGCMLGRYSLDVDGLAYAGGEWDAGKYKTFLPDEDNCIPVTDEEYFKDDIVGRFVEFVRTVYGSDTLEENLDFIANALGNKGNTSREVIRNYFLNDFIKDHFKTYQKRPIYWMFDSGKQNGFKALVYMHRWDADTTGNVRVEYLHRIQRVYESEINRMQDTIDNSGNAREITAAQKRKDKLAKQLKESKDYDAKIAHLALSRIDIDLDDGVKTNYEKVQTGQDGKKIEILTAIK